MNNWREALETDELCFWREWFETKGLLWKEDYTMRLDIDSETQPYIAKYITGTNISILDVGSGPLSIIGKRHNGEYLNIFACDALGDRYNELFEEFGIQPIVPVVKCDMEKLGEVYGERSFDIVFAQNCVDHSYNPIEAIRQMISIVSGEGHVLLRHEENEAEKEAYKGLHQWNFSCEGGLFFISGRNNQRFCVNDIFSGIAVVETEINNGIIFNEIRRVCV